ncbi:hypothetical protein [Microlunatus sp. Gsoil 973]|uniref:hypothetical protein n=1 Tax=Microlunatus sp. Gsoil 973 TaxID=2672569 RepID=UPI0012B44CC3|nr:hypothetical protein [Microlunatus sp. Gsoil 973]QGN34331.1 hypothetical protein GJV80_17585 [Microlunatus sp. Gsoil 973]
MFIQIIQGKCTKQDELHALADSWREELSPGATGWLGGTYGFTDDDMFIGVVRFESREAAMANSNRPEQTAWAEKFAACMDGPLTFHDCEDVTLMMDGGSDNAGFVQVIRGKVSDPSAIKSLFADTTQLQAMRPEIIGATLAIEDDGTFTETVAFTDEAAAREGEKLQPPEEIKDMLDSMMSDATFYDLHHPWFESSTH